MNAFELSPTKILRDTSAIEPIGLHSLSWGFGDHRRGSHQAGVGLGRKPVIQPVARRARLIGKGNPLRGEVLAYELRELLHTIGHAQRSDEVLGDW